AMKGCEQPPQFHPEGDVFKHTRIMLEMLPPESSLPLVFSVLFHDVAKPPTAIVDDEGRIRFNGHDRIGAEMTEAIMVRLRFSRAEIDATVEAVRQHMVFKDVPNMRMAKLKRFMARPTFEDELELHRVDCASSHAMLDNYEFLLKKKEEFANEPIIPPPLVRGAALVDVLEALPRELRARKHEVGIAMPYYREISENMALDLRDTGITVDIPVGEKTYVAEFIEGRTASGVQTFFIRCDTFFDRASIYGEHGVAYEDNS